MKKIEKLEELPVFYLDFDEENMIEGMDALSFVSSPATQIKWEIFQDVEDSYNDYPIAASTNACRALKYKEKNPTNDCGTRVGWTRANQLCNRRNITVETIARMASFKRHQQNKDVPYEEGCGGLMYDCWGGTEGVEWAIRKMEYINNQLKASTFNKFETMDEEKRLVTAPVMLAETKILRYNETLGKYYVKFSKDTIERMMQKYFKENKIHKVNLNHDPKSKQDNIYMVESYIVGDRNTSKIFTDVPEGTWMATFLVDNDEVWQKIKDGTFQGFSLEAYLTEKYEDEIIDDLEMKLKKIINSQMSDEQMEIKIKELLNL